MPTLPSESTFAFGTSDYLDEAHTYITVPPPETTGTIYLSIATTAPFSSIHTVPTMISSSPVSAAPDAPSYPDTTWIYTVSVGGATTFLNSVTPSPADAPKIEAYTPPYSIRNAAHRSLTTLLFVTIGGSVMFAVLFLLYDQRKSIRKLSRNVSVRSATHGQIVVDNQQSVGQEVAGDPATLSPSPPRLCNQGSSYTVLPETRYLSSSSLPMSEGSSISDYPNSVAASVLPPTLSHTDTLSLRSSPSNASSSYRASTASLSSELTITQAGVWPVPPSDPIVLQGMTDTTRHEFAFLGSAPSPHGPGDAATYENDVRSPAPSCHTGRWEW